MTYLTGEVTVIHNVDQVDFENFAYSKVYFDDAATIFLNGTRVTGVAGETLEVVVDGNNTTPIVNVLLLGNPIPVQTKFETGLISGDSSNEVYQFVNIKNGNPTG